MGSILCNFLLKHFPKDIKKKNEKVDDKEENKEIIKKFDSVFDEGDIQGIDVSFSVFGLRNLLYDCYNPTIEIKLTGQNEDEEYIKEIKLPNPEDDFLQQDLDWCRKNPNFN